MKSCVAAGFRFVLLTVEPSTKGRLAIEDIHKQWVVILMLFAIFALSVIIGLLCIVFKMLQAHTDLTRANRRLRVQLVEQDLLIMQLAGRTGCPQDRV